MSMLDNKILAIIPARAGSVGVKHKNIRSFCGYPLFRWSVEAAIRCPYIDKVVVSSDYLNLHEFYTDGVQYISRPPELCSSTSSTESCLLHAVDFLKQLGEYFEYIVTLQPTSPIRLSNMLSECIEQVVRENTNSLISVQEHTPLFFQKTHDGIKWFYNPRHRKMRQEFSDEEMFLHDDGNLYITKTQTLVSDRCRIDSNPSIYINDPYCSMQIDTETDFTILEKIEQEIRDTNKYISIREMPC